MVSIVFLNQVTFFLASSEGVCGSNRESVHKKKIKKWKRQINDLHL